MSRSRSVRRAVVVGATIATAVGVLGAVPATAAPSDVVISELMYNPASDVDADEFLELANPGGSPVDLSGWCLGGVTFCFPAGSTIGAGEYLVLSPDPARTIATYGVGTAGVYTGSLKNSGEAVVLKDASSATIDSVSYLDVAPWPVTPDGLGPSLELIDPSLDHNDSANWAAATNNPGQTAGSANSVATSGLGPAISGMAASPAVPAPGEDVTVTATVTGHTGTPAVVYRLDFGAERTVPMTSSGGDTFTAVIPGAAAGHLIRYKVVAGNASRAAQLPRTDDTIDYEGVVVGHGVSSALPVLEWFLAPADYAAITGNPTAEIERFGALAYGGTVWDNVKFNIRGQASQTSFKPNWKVELPANHDFMMPTLAEPVDEFNLQADTSDRSHGRASLSWEASRMANLGTMTMFPVRVQRNASFQGLYNFMEQFDGTWRDREGRSDDQVFKAEKGAFSPNRVLFEYRFEKKEPEDMDFSMLEEFLDAVVPQGANAHDFLQANADVPQLINYAAVAAIIRHVDSSSKNFFLIQESHSGRWEIILWDLDHTWGNDCCGVTTPFVTPAEPADRTSELMTALLADPQWRSMYFRRLRSLVDEILAPGVMEGVYDARFAAAAADSNLDFRSWPYPSSTLTYAQMRTRLFTALNDRRAAFARDARLPAAQVAQPNVVIAELQVSPTGGNAAEYVELTNPSATTAVDLSGWTLGGAVDKTLQDGLVLLPGGSTVIVANDPTFRTTYSSAIFVGDRYTGDLAAAETLTLARPDGSVADTVTYGGAGWPDASTGRSLELTDTAANNDEPSSWELSAEVFGSPGSPNDALDTAAVPGAARVRSAVPGDSVASVTWRAPFTDRGAAVTEYQIRAVNGAGQQVGPLVSVPGTARSGQVVGLTNGTAYRFQVAAVNRKGAGGFSALSSAVTPSVGLTAPGRPVIGTASQGSSGGVISVIGRWAPPALSGGLPVTGYRIFAERMSSAAPDAHVVEWIPSEIMSASRRSREFQLPEGFYRFQVVAINAIGTSVTSSRSNVVSPR